MIVRKLRPLFGARKTWASPVGHVDAATRSLIEGWVINPGDPGVPVHVLAVANGAIVATSRADEHRPDVLAAGHATSLCGFSCQLPTDASQIELYVGQVPNPDLKDAKFWTKLELTNQAAMSDESARPAKTAMAPKSGLETKPELKSQAAMSGESARPAETAMAPKSGLETKPELKSQAAISDQSTRPAESAQAPKWGRETVLRTPPKRASNQEYGWLLMVTDFCLRNEMLIKAESLMRRLWDVRSKLTDSQLSHLLLLRIRIERAVCRDPDLTFCLLADVKRAKPHPRIRIAQQYAIRRALHIDPEEVTERHRLAEIAFAKSRAALLEKAESLTQLGTEEALAIASSFALQHRAAKSGMMADESVAPADAKELYGRWLQRALGFTSQTAVNAIDLDADNVLQSVDLYTPQAIDEGPLVSVIMSCFNSEGTVAYALRSLLQQSYRNIEVLVCDDRSDDRSYSIIEEIAANDPRVRVFRSELQQGTYNIRNNLIAVANGEFVTFQDADDYALPDRIEKQQRIFSSIECDAVMGDWVRILPSGEFVIFSDGNIVRQSTVSLMARRDTFLTTGGYLPARFGADSHFLETLRQNGGVVHRLSDVLILGLWSDSSLTRSPGMEAAESGYRAEKRRAFAELCAERRLLGDEIVPDTALIERMEAIGVHITASISRAA